MSFLPTLVRAYVRTAQTRKTPKKLEKIKKIENFKSVPNDAKCIVNIPKLCFRVFSGLLKVIARLGRPTCVLC